MTRPKRLTTLAELDGRTIAAKQAHATISAIESDLGGAENITTAKRQIIESAAVTSAMVADLVPMASWRTNRSSSVHDALQFAATLA
jgi:hypothetical protein